MLDFKPHAYLYVDGSSTRSEDIGAWAAMAVTRTKRKLLYGVEYPSTISRCELLPIIAGLNWIRKKWWKIGFKVLVTSDSEYTVRTLCGEYERRKNLDLWANLDFITERMQVEYIWRERNSSDYGTLCDGICGPLRKSVINSMSTVFQDVRAPEIDIPAYTYPGDIETKTEEACVSPPDDMLQP